jgi:DNA-binding MarR family transcriptional regulator
VPNPADRRSLLVEPTQEGRAAAKRVAGAFAAIEARIGDPAAVHAALATVDAAVQATAAEIASTSSSPSASDAA